MESPTIPATNPSRYSGSKRKSRPASMEITEFTPSQVTKQIISRPLYRRSRKRGQSNIHRFRRSYNAGVIITTDGINPTYGTFNFSINDMPGYTEFTALFDSYKITGIKLLLIPYTQTQSISTSSLNNARNVPFFYVIDRTDATMPTSVDEILEYQDHKISNIYDGWKLWIPNPKFSDATSAMRGGIRL